MTSWYLNIWKVKISLSRKQKEVSKLNKKNFLALKELYFRHTKETSKNIADTNFKACICYFSFFFFFFTKWQCLNNYEKCFLFHLKSSFHCQDIQILVFPSSSLFFPVKHWLRGWWKKNLKVYGVSNCLNKNLILFNILRRKKEITLNFVNW